MRCTKTVSDTLLVLQSPGMATSSVFSSFDLTKPQPTKQQRTEHGWRLGAKTSKRPKGLTEQGAMRMGTEGDRRKMLHALIQACRLNHAMEFDTLLHAGEPTCCYISSTPAYLRTPCPALLLLAWHTPPPSHPLHILTLTLTLTLAPTSTSHQQRLSRPSQPSTTLGVPVDSRDNLGNTSLIIAAQASPPPSCWSCPSSRAPDPQLNVQYLRPQRQSTNPNPIVTALCPWFEPWSDPQVVIQML